MCLDSHKRILNRSVETLGDSVKPFVRKVTKGCVILYSFQTKNSQKRWSFLGSVLIQKRKRKRKRKERRCLLRNEIVEVLVTTLNPQRGYVNSLRFPSKISVPEKTDLENSSDSFLLSLRVRKRGGSKTRRDARVKSDTHPYPVPSPFFRLFPCDLIEFHFRDFVEKVKEKEKRGV